MSSLLSQIKILTWKNLLVKKADKKIFYVEIYGIIFMVLFNFLVSFMERESNNFELKTNSRTEPIDINPIFQQIYVPTNDVYMGFVFPSVSDTENNEKLTQYIMENDVFKAIPQLKYKTFQNENELNDFNNHENLLAGIIFSQNTEYNDYTIRMNRTFVPDPTLKPITPIEKLLNGKGKILGDKTEADDYLDYFVPIQMVVDEAIIQYKTNTSIHMNTNFGNLEIDINYIPRYSNDVMMYVFVIVLFSTCFCLSLTRYITIEKETGLKKTLSLNGVSLFAYYISWLIIVAAMMISFTIVFLIEDLITKSLTLEVALLKFILTLLFNFGTIAVFIFISLFFKSSQALDKFNGYFICFYMYLPYMLNFDGIDFDFFLLDLFFPSFSIYNAYQELYYCQRLKVNIFEFMSNNKRLIYYTICLIFSFLLYTIITIIMDKNLSEENGSLIRKLKQNISGKKGNGNLNSTSDDSEKYAQDIEPMETTEKCMVDISDVVMQFKNEKSKNNGDENETSTSNSDSDILCAVNHVSFKVYENEIFGILGHNGAGKSTLINIMTGLIHPNHGQIYYNGQDFFSNKEALRKQFGICPQNCSLFESLTVEQNIIIFARLKEIEVNVDEILGEVDLLDKKLDIVGILSGGQKKKLNVAIALMGNPKYVFLDEPSTGLDPFSRRKMWDLIKKNKQGKVIFLTTHYMDEADILTDRKLILHHGVIRCLGTSMYLKKHFNVMYHLKVETDHYLEAFQLIQSHIPEVIESSKEENENENENENEIILDNNKSSQVYTFKLPTDSSCNLPKLIKDLENQVENKTIIQNFSISLPSLEELFVRLNSENISTNPTKLLDASDTIHEEESAILVEKKSKLLTYENITKPSDSTIIRSIISHKFKLYFKSKTFIFYTFIVPLIFSIIIFLFYRLSLNKNYKTEYSAEVLNFNKLYNNTLWNYDVSASNVDKKIFETGFVSQGKTFDIHTLDRISKNITSNDSIYAVSLSANQNNTDFFMDVFYNKTMPHSPPASFNAISNSILQSKNPNEKITVSSQPFPVINSINNEMMNLLFSLFIANILIISLSSYGLTIVKEKAKGLKKQLFLNQVSNKCYWLSSILIDGSFYMVSCLIFVIIGLILRCEALYHIWSILVILLIIVIGATASISNQYVLSLMFKKEITAQTFLLLINMFFFGLGFAVFFGISALKMIDVGNSIGFSSALIIVSIVFTIIFPPFSLIIAFNQLFNIHLSHELYGTALTFGNYFKFNTGFIPILISLLVAFLFYYFILLMVDSKKTVNEDIPQRIREMMHIEELNLRQSDELYNELEDVKRNKDIMPISVFHVVKEFAASIPSNKQIKDYIKRRSSNQYGEIHRSSYKNGLVRTIIEDVTFGVKEKECFGLLGPNGVGKSTLLNTIIQKYMPTSGRVYYNGVESTKTDNIIGYCPQENILWDELSILDHLVFYLQIRGVAKDKVKEYALQYIDQCHLTEHMNKPVRKLSGGTKRKLSLLLAVCAYPLQIILDEPTSGVDPATRTFIWDLIKEIRETRKSSIILTTHSIEEAQELCNRLTILINGRLVCIGSPEYLRMKYASCYFLEIQTEHQEQIHEILFDKEVGAFADYTYKLENLTNHRYKYQIKMKKGLGKLFEIVEKAKKDGLVTEYTISQSNLEQVFIDFTKQFKNN